MEPAKDLRVGVSNAILEIHSRHPRPSLQDAMEEASQTNGLRGGVHPLSNFPSALSFINIILFKKPRKTDFTKQLASL